MKSVSSIVLACFLTVQATAFMPADALASASDDLKRIEYKYYFRGNYEAAIAELRAFLQRNDLARADIVEAREYLAASLILSGATGEGKAQYVELLKMDGAYAGPDPSVFKSVIIATYNEAKAEYASMVIRTVPETDAPSPSTAPAAAELDDEGKPLYKKWWFYATMGAVLLVIAGAAGSGGDDAEPTPQRDTGTVTVEVGIP